MKSPPVLSQVRKSLRLGGVSGLGIAIDGALLDLDTSYTWFFLDFVFFFSLFLTALFESGLLRCLLGFFVVG